MKMILKKLTKWFCVFGIPLLMLILGYVYPLTLPASVFVTWFAVLFVRTDFEHYAKGLERFLDDIDDNIINLDKNLKVLKSGLDSSKKEFDRYVKTQENKRDKTKGSVRPHQSHPTV